MPLRLQHKFTTFDNNWDTLEHISTVDESTSNEAEYFRYYLPDDQHQNFIYALSEKLEENIEEFLHLIESGSMADALEKLIECLSAAAVGMQRYAKCVKNKLIP